jgi:hypothetical protein
MMHWSPQGKEVEEEEEEEEEEKGDVSTDL